MPRSYHHQPHKTAPWHFPLLGWITLIGVAVLLISTVILEAGLQHLGVVVVSAFLNVCFLLLVLFVVMWIGYLVFGTHGVGHYQLRLWHTFDLLLAEVLAQTGLSMVLWMAAGHQGNYAMFSHTDNRDPFYALYDQFIYIANMLNGGGIIDNLPLGEAARITISLQLLAHSFTILVILSALVATLTTHSDEGARRRYEDKR
jgi:hypothetical protein